jgi:hypothetical protein
MFLWVALISASVFKKIEDAAEERWSFLGPARPRDPPCKATAESEQEDQSFQFVSRPDAYDLWSVKTRKTVKARGPRGSENCSLGRMTNFSRTTEPPQFLRLARPGEQT